MHYRVLFFCFLLLAATVRDGRCETALAVTVEGVEGKLHDNIMARLRINLYRQDSELTETEIRRLHRLASEDIASALAPYGYYQPTVEATLTRGEDGWQAVYRVRPGEPVRVKSFSLAVEGEGAALPELADPSRLFVIQEGAVLHQPLYESGKKSLIRQARALGFLEASYRVHEIRIHRDRREADLELVLDTGPRYRFGKTTREQDIITDELLMRFVPYQEGDYYNSRELYNLQRDLYRTDYFGSVIVEGGIEDADGLYIPVSITVEPHENYNRYSYGIGYATDTRAHLLFEWRNKLFNKKGHRTYSSFLVGEQESHCIFNYKIPVADPRSNSLAFAGQWNREQWEDTITSLLSAGIAYEYSTPKFHYGISLEVLDEDFRVGDTTGISQMLIPGIQGSWAFADDLVNTENGLRASIRISGANENLFSDATFIKGRADGKLILSPIKNWRLIGRGSIGAILVDSIDDIPPSVRFYAGGDKSVRGYRYRTLGPVDSAGSVVGGKFLLTGGIECERRFGEYWRASVFYDVGNAMDDLAVDLVHGIGVGAGVVLPFGQISLNFAYPLMDEGTAQYVFLSVGTDL